MEAELASHVAFVNVYVSLLTLTSERNAKMSSAKSDRITGATT